METNGNGNGLVKVEFSLFPSVAPTLSAEEFTGKLAGLLKRLKKDTGCVAVRQNYKGTGSKSHRRQLYLGFANGETGDVWLEADRIEFGGVILFSGIPRGTAIEYGDKSPEQVYAEVVAVFTRARAE